MRLNILKIIKLDTKRMNICIFLKKIIFSPQPSPFEYYQERVRSIPDVV